MKLTSLEHRPAAGHRYRPRPNPAGCGQPATGDRQGPAGAHPRPALGAPQAKPMAEDAKALRVTVRSFVIDGASLIPVAELSAIQDLTGQSLTLAELEQAAQRIAQHYRQRGWYVRVYLPVQDVTGGEIRIQVLEGRYGGVQREDKGRRANGPFVEAAPPLAPASPFPPATWNGACCWPMTFPASAPPASSRPARRPVPRACCCRPMTRPSSPATSASIIRG